MEFYKDGEDQEPTDIDIATLFCSVDIGKFGVSIQFNPHGPPETLWAALNPIDALRLRNVIVPRAVGETIAQFNRNGHNDASDAFRHAFLSYLIAEELGASTALVITDAHERYTGAPLSETLMDLHNNRFGIGVSLQQLSEQDAIQAILKGIMSGEVASQPFSPKDFKCAGN